MPTHAETKVLPYTPRQMFDLVVDVEAYPEFLPWCLDCKIFEHKGNRILADLTVGYKIFRETFTSEVLIDEKKRVIDVRYIRGPFRYLDNHWAFKPVGRDKCEISFNIDFEFRTPFLQKVMGLFFNEAVRRMISAFESRANQLYG